MRTEGRFAGLGAGEHQEDAPLGLPDAPLPPVHTKPDRIANDLEKLWRRRGLDFPLPGQ